MSEPKPEPFLVAAERLRQYTPEADILAIDPTIFTGEPDPVIAARKLSALMNVSCCLMTDSTGVNYCDHPLPPPPPLCRRLRWRLSSWWSDLRMRVGSRIAGVDLNRWDEE